MAFFVFLVHRTILLKIFSISPLHLMEDLFMNLVLFSCVISVIEFLLNVFHPVQINSLKLNYEQNFRCFNVCAINEISH